MKRYLVFIGDHYYPGGGFIDFDSDYDSEKDAIDKAKSIDDEDQWAHVYDIEERKEVFAI